MKSSHSALQSKRNSKCAPVNMPPNVAPNAPFERALWMRAKMRGTMRTDGLGALHWSGLGRGSSSSWMGTELPLASRIPNAPSDNTSTLPSANIPSSCMTVCAMQYPQTVQTVWVYTLCYAESQTHVVRCEVKSTWVCCKNTWRLASITSCVKSSTVWVV